MTGINLFDPTTYFGNDPIISAIVWVFLIEIFGFAVTIGIAITLVYKILS
tara:strand:- start:28 stop:177 length:150 start_codon:yes stop_codon:yes gene_type:complete